MSAPATKFKPRVIKRDLLSDGQELEALIVSAACQAPSPDTNAKLARINEGAVQSESNRMALEIIEVVGRNPDQAGLLVDLQSEFGNSADPWALDEYVTKLNALYFKFRREHQITQFSPDEFKATRCTDVANGLRFKQQFEGVALHSRTLSWLVWDARRFLPDEKAARELAKQVPDAVRAEIKALAADMDMQDREAADRFQEYVEALTKWSKVSASTRGINSTLTEAESIPGITADALKFDAQPWLLNCLNGTLDLRSGELLYHDPKHLLTKLVPHDYKADAKCPRWLKFLDEVFNGDQELIDYIQWALGYSITGDVSQHVFFMMHGTGRNGKGALIRAIAHAMGLEYFATLNSEELLAQKYARNSTAIAAIAGARFVACQETDKGRNLNEAQVKTLTGGDRLKARFLFKDEFEFDPTFKIWMATNHKPVIDGEGAQGNLWERIRLIPFLRKFEAGEKDTQLDQKLMDEAEGILAWLVVGARRAATGPEPQVPAIVTKVTTEYKKESDTLGEFLEEVTHKIPAAKCSKTEFHDRYCKWAHTTVDYREFNKKVAARGILDKRTGTGMVWIGIAIRPEFIEEKWIV